LFAQHIEKADAVLFMQLFTIIEGELAAKFAFHRISMPIYLQATKCESNPDLQ